MIQGGGAGMLVSASDAAGFKRGENIILGGLILQILIFGFFVVVAGIWHVRLQKGPTAASADIPWTKLIWFLYAASVCITIRNLCRVIEYAMGKVCFVFLWMVGYVLIDTGWLSVVARVADLCVRLFAYDDYAYCVCLVVRPEH